MKKREILYLIIIVMLIVTNILTLVLKNNKDNKIEGIYQIDYYNEYNKPMVEVLKIKDEKSCEFLSGLQTSKDYRECQYEKNGNKISFKIKKLYYSPDIAGDEYENINGELLNSGNIYMNNHELKKIN